jgi:hypothetical protein
MYARIVAAEVDPENLEPATRAFREQGLPAYRAMGGFRSTYFLIHRRRGKAIALSLWETAEDARAPDRGVAGARERVTAELGLRRAPDVAIYEISVWDLVEGSALEGKFGRVVDMRVPAMGSGRAYEFDHSRTLPGLRAKAGYLGYGVFVDPASGRGLGISLWNSREEERATQEGGAALQAEARQSSASAVTFLDVAVYEIAVQA